MYSKSHYCSSLQLRVPWIFQATIDYEQSKQKENPRKIPHCQTHPKLTNKESARAHLLCIRFICFTPVLCRLLKCDMSQLSTDGTGQLVTSSRSPDVRREAATMDQDGRVLMKVCEKGALGGCHYTATHLHTAAGDRLHCYQPWPKGEKRLICYNNPQHLNKLDLQFRTNICRQCLKELSEKRQGSQKESHALVELNSRRKIGALEIPAFRICVQAQFMVVQNGEKSNSEYSSS